jgi:ribosomal-protein-alanine N-acetyltransferase
VHRMLPGIPARMEARRVRLPSIEAGDGPWYYAISQRNRTHLARCDADSIVISIASEQEAGVLLELAALWRVRNAFFMGAFDRVTDEFVAQVYVRTVNPDLPEFEIGFFVEKDHEGQGYVTEAVRAALGFAFDHLRVHRVRMECDDNNEPSWRMAERCGMIRQGPIRENKVDTDGELSGTPYFGLPKREFEALPLPARS